MKKQTSEELRDFRFSIIKSQLESDPELALEVALYLEDCLESMLKKINGNSIIHILKRAKEKIKNDFK